MAHITIEVYLDADGNLDADLENCLTDEAVVRDLATSAAFALRDAVAEYLGVNPRYIYYDCEILEH